MTPFELEVGAGPGTAIEVAEPGSVGTGSVMGFVFPCAGLTPRITKKYNMQPNSAIGTSAGSGFLNN